MTREQAIQEVNKVFEPAFANYIIIALTEGATVSDKEQEPVYFPPCVDCNTKMNEIREAYDKLKNQEPCEDAVSRKAVDLLCFEFLRANSDDNCAFYERFRDLPAVTPTRKVGEWIYHEKSISTGFKSLRECSCCHCYFRWEMPRNSYCPNCGADMRESEGKE